LDDIFVFLITTPVVAHSLPFPSAEVGNEKEIRAIDDESDSDGSGRTNLGTR
jgi:hypothetical protein